MTTKIFHGPSFKENPPTLTSKKWDPEFLASGLEMDEPTKAIITMAKYMSCGVDKPNAHVQSILDSPRITPNTPVWLAARGKYLTASAMAGVLGQSKYAKPHNVLKQKTHQCRPFKGNQFTAWGSWYEAEAAVIYQYLTGLPLVEDVGLMVHPYEKIKGVRRYAGTPDFITYNGILVEIKCPVMREIGNFVPEHYMAQLQMQMEVANVNFLHFVQYRPHDMYTDGIFNIVGVPRDMNWWATSVPIFDKLWDKVIEYYASNNLELGEYCAELAWKPPPPKPIKKLVCDTSMTECTIFEPRVYLEPWSPQHCTIVDMDEMDENE